MKYGVDISVEGFFHWEGNVPSEENAKDCAIEACSEADFGPLENIDFNVYKVEVEDRIQ